MRNLFSWFILLAQLGLLQGQEPFYQESKENRLLKGSDLLKTDQAEVRLQIQDQLRAPTSALDWSGDRSRASDFSMSSVYRFSDDLRWDNQWKLRAHSTLREPDWNLNPTTEMETSGTGWNQLLETSVILGSNDGPWKVKTFVQRENDFAHLESRNAFQLRQGLEGSYALTRWSKIRSEIRQEQSFLENELALQRDIMLLNLSQQVISQPWRLSLTPSFTEESKTENLTLERSAFTRAWESAIHWSPRGNMTWSWGSKLRQTDSPLERWDEKGGGLFTEWQQQLTPQWSSRARWEVEKTDRTSRQNTAALQEFTRSNLRLMQAWSFNETTQAQFEISHRNEYERLESQRQTEQRIGVSLRSSF